MLFQQCLFEFLGTMILVLMGDGVCAACTLNKSKAQGAGWVVITLAWGFAVMCGVLVAGPVSGAHLNPAVTFGLALAGLFPWYVDHFAATSDNPDGMLGCFCTMPAIDHKTVNFFSEFLATFVLVFLILAIGSKGNTPMAGDVPIGLGAVGAFPVTAVIMSLGMSLGATTGYAMNPARDTSPRLAHMVLPIRGKRDSGWSYGWIPAIAPLVGGAFAAAIFLLVF